MFSVFYDPLFTHVNHAQRQLLLCLLAENLMEYVPGLQDHPVQHRRHHGSHSPWVEHRAQVRLRAWEKLTKLTGTGHLPEDVYRERQQPIRRQYSTARSSARVLRVRAGWHRTTVSTGGPDSRGEGALKVSPIRETLASPVWPDGYDFMPGEGAAKQVT